MFSAICDLKPRQVGASLGLFSEAAARSFVPAPHPFRGPCPRARAALSGLAGTGRAGSLDSGVAGASDA